MTQKLAAKAAERETLLAFGAWLADQQLTLCTHDPLVDQFWPTHQDWPYLIDQYHGIDRAQLWLERNDAMSSDGCPCG